MLICIREDNMMVKVTRLIKTLNMKLVALQVMVLSLEVLGIPLPLAVVVEVVTAIVVARVSAAQVNFSIKQ